MEDRHYTDLLLELECPICTNYMTPPIRQCATGHSICEDCRRRLPKCALCQGIFTESRNIALEGLAVKMRYPCINKDSGCTLKLAYNEREVHESKCVFSGYKCTMEKCSWVGRLEDIPEHWASKKMTSKPFRQTNVCQAKLKSDSYYINLVEAHGKLFWYKFKSNKKRLCFAMQYIGKSFEAESFYYEIDLFKPDRPKRKILISDYCRPVEMDNATLFNGACISLPPEMIEPFLGEDQLLVYNMRVQIVKGSKMGEDASGVTAQASRGESKGPQNDNKNKDKSKKDFQRKNKAKKPTG